MYMVVVFRGGPHRFHEFEEFVNDAGGLVIRKDVFSVNRGSYFLRNELRVLCVVPEAEEEKLKRTARRIKGEVERVSPGPETSEILMACLEVYDTLAGTESWIEGGDLPFEGKVLERMVETELLESRKQGGSTQYRLKRD